MYIYDKKDKFKYLTMTSTVIIVFTAYVCCKNLALRSINDVILLSSIVKILGSE